MELWLEMGKYLVSNNGNGDMPGIVLGPRNVDGKFTEEGSDNFE